MRGAYVVATNRNSTFSRFACFPVWHPYREQQQVRNNWTSMALKTKGNLGFSLYTFRRNRPFFYIHDSSNVIFDFDVAQRTLCMTRQSVFNSANTKAEFFDDFIFMKKNVIAHSFLFVNVGGWLVRWWFMSINYRCFQLVSDLWTKFINTLAHGSESTISGSQIHLPPTTAVASVRTTRPLPIRQNGLAPTKHYSRIGHSYKSIGTGTVHCCLFLARGKLINS